MSVQEWHYSGLKSVKGYGKTRKEKDVLVSVGSQWG